VSAQKEQITILWFKRDLRTQDHSALCVAAQLGFPVLPLYVVEPALWMQSEYSGRQWDFTKECLFDLRTQLGALGMPLVVRRGAVCQVLTDLAANFKVCHLVAHEETGTTWTFQRDLQVHAWCRDNAIRFDELPQSGVVRRLDTRDHWARARDRFVDGVRPHPPKALKKIDIDIGHIPDWTDVSDDTDYCPLRQHGDRKAALRALDEFWGNGIKTYRWGMSSPVTAPHVCSRISPYLALGVMSIREVAQMSALRAKNFSTPAKKGYASFQSRLAWRDHFIQKLEDEPDLDQVAMHRAYDNLRPREGNETLLRAWEQGETGLPFLDACMRSLQSTGWLNFRMRAMVMSVATYHLWLDWRAAGTRLARLFTDYEPGIHWSQVQMQSGITGMNSIRIYNPMKQAVEHDPNGAFVRRWCPELRNIPDVYLHEPWKWDGAANPVGKTYPSRVVDFEASARAARDRIWAVRKDRTNKAETAKVIAKHASRKAPTRRRRSPSKKTDQAQLGFDF
jgi:deoxyribodipyrimidine photo-lyase